MVDIDNKYIGERIIKYQYWYMLYVNCLKLYDYLKFYNLYLLDFSYLNFYF